MRARGHDHGEIAPRAHTCAAGGRQRQGEWDKGGGLGAHKHQGCQSPTELVVGVSMDIEVGYGSVKWRFSAGERGQGAPIPPSGPLGRTSREK